MASIHEIETLSKYNILREVIKDYPGLLGATEPLFRALEEEPRNWRVVVKEIRAYALKQFYILDQHDKGKESLKVIFDVFFEALKYPETPVQQSAVDSILFYLEKIMLDSAQDLNEYASLLLDCLEKLDRLQKKQFFFVVTNPHQLKKIGKIMLEKNLNIATIEKFNNLLVRSFLATYEYWLGEEDPIYWFEGSEADLPIAEKAQELTELLYPVSHTNLKELLLHIRTIEKTADQYERLKELLNFPGYIQLVKYYEEVLNKIAQIFDTRDIFNIKVLYFLKILETKGLSIIHENILREIHRTLSTVIATEDVNAIKSIVSEIGPVLKESFTLHPETVLYCIQSIGNAIYAKGDSSLVEWYLQNIISLGFQYPNIKGVTDEWQVKTNRSHLRNIRVWLELIENNPKWSTSLISALIINLRLSGVHVNDTDLFQKDITRLLNSDIKPVYHLVKQLAKVFPVYFSDIGAEGTLREVSTEVDETVRRNDILVHFLRKQSHVESSDRVVDFIEEVIQFWRTKDKAPLKGFLPEDVYERIDTSGPFIDEMHAIFHNLFAEKKLSSVTDLLNIKKEELLASIKAIPHVSEQERKRAYLALKFYQLLYRKYRFDYWDIIEQLRSSQILGLPRADSLIEALEHDDICQRLESILGYLESLRNIILSPEKYEPVENIFRRRHIAVGIPSVYGNYHEKKFDALSLTFRLENLANVLFEEMISSINLTFITRATLFQTKKYANLFFMALKLDGISSYRLENSLELLTVALEVRRFSFTQYIDIFRGFSEAVMDIFNTYYSGIYKNNLKQLILQAGTENIQLKLLDPHKKQEEFELINKVSERFLREIVATSFGLQQVDNFISRILKTLFEQAEGLDVQNLDLLMSYDPKKALSGIHIPNKSTDDRIHLGSKGYNLKRIASLGIPVPPGFIVTTEVFRCEQAINKFNHAREYLYAGIKEQLVTLEKQTGKRFGDPQNPLLVSVRSGGAISMPGMMISFLNVGINESIIEGMIQRTGKPWFVWDCYRRFLQGWGMSFGMERDTFDDIINSFKSRYKVLRKILFTPEQMKEVAYAYSDAIQNEGIEISDSPREQLDTAIAQVFKSWFSQKAQAYREILGISEKWGTAVIVQSMVYGNLDTNAGTGVLFTRNPQVPGEKVMLWGDFALGAQGEDIVSGLIKTLPLSKEQKPFEERTGEISFEESFPEHYSELFRIAKDLIYRERWGAQEIEFTFEGKEKESLYILQTRDMAITRRERFIAFVPSKKLSSHCLSRGIGVGGGALSGRVVFDLNEMNELRDKDPHTPLILVRSDTVPDDIRHISAADGLLTARGGSTCHAAIIANRLGKTCVVGCNKLIVWEHEKRCKINRKIVKVGDFLSIDGRNGSVYAGKQKVQEIKADIVTKI